MSRLAAAILACAALAACAPPALRTLDQEPYVRGPVESITHHATASGILVRAGPASREACGIAATADARTRYLERAPGGALQPLDRSALAVGDTVEVYVDGPVAESCPVQGRAGTIVRVARARPAG